MDLQDLLLMIFYRTWLLGNGTSESHMICVKNASKLGENVWLGLENLPARTTTAGNCIVYIVYCIFHVKNEFTLVYNYGVYKPCKLVEMPRNGGVQMKYQAI